MEWTINKIRHAFNGRLIGNRSMEKMVCQAVFYLPDKIVKYITHKVWFISSPEDAWAFTFRGSDIGNQHLIIISDELLKQKEAQVEYTILHEIGHVILGHRNSIGYQQSEREIKQQEREADKFAKKYLNEDS